MTDDTVEIAGKHFSKEFVEMFEDKLRAFRAEIERPLREENEEYKAAIEKDLSALMNREKELEGLLETISRLEFYANHNAELANKRDSRIEQLESALRGVLPYVVTQVVACGGMKCREAVCESCSFDAEIAAQDACEKYSIAVKTLG